MWRLIDRFVGPSVGALITLLFRLTRRRAGVILLYHTVAPCQGDPQHELVPPLATADFRRQLSYLVRHYDVVPLDRFRDAVAERQRWARFPVSITFDDDAPEHVIHALPVLREYGATATFFLCGAFGGEPAADPWWHRLQRAVDHGVALDTITRLLPTGTDAHQDGEPGDIHALAEAITRLPREVRENVSSGLLQLAGPALGPGMPRSDVAVLGENGCTIGFHTLRHERLTTLDDGELEEALDAGRADLAELAGHALTVLAYPHGGSDNRVAEASRRAGFTIGLTDQRRGATPRSNPLLLGRYAPAGGAHGPFALGLVRTLLSTDDG
jgi:peptidoglycan/xylan/chitin deacetylase (PgdA/CDA1 family)